MRSPFIAWVVNNAVASMGTALSPEQIKSLATLYRIEASYF